MRDRIGIKMQAKDIMRGARVSPYLMTLILLGIGFVLNKVVEMVQYGTPFYSLTFMRQYFDIIARGDFDALEALVNAIPEDTTVSFFFSSLVSLFTVVLNGGY